MFLIEKIDNAFQLISLGILLALSLYKAVSLQNRTWALLAMFYGATSLGNLYWFLYMVLYGETPWFSFIPDFCWISAYLFQVMLLLYVKKEEWKWRDLKILWLIPVFTVAMALFYMRWGEYLTNTAYAVFMTQLLICSICGIRFSEKKTGRYYICLVSLSYCIVEYCLWTSSCIEWKGIGLLNPYYFFDVLLTLVSIFFYPAVGKAAEDELH